MLTVSIPLLAASERSRSEQVDIRLGAHCTERPEVNRDKPNPELCLRTAPRPSTPNRYSRPSALGTRRRLRRRSGISPLYDVKFADHALAWQRPSPVARDGIDSLSHGCLVEPDGIEPTTSSLQS